MADTPREADREPLDEPIAETEEVDTAVSTDYKVLGRKDAPAGTGVLGHNTANSGMALGVEGVTDSADAGATGVRGHAPATSGLTFGVHGLTESSTGIGVFAEAPNGGGSHALFARADGPGAETVLAKATATTGGPIAIEGHTQGRGTDAAGVSGITLGSPSDATGVRGYHQSTDGSGSGVEGVTDSADSSAAGLRGRAPNGGRGVHATASSGIGVLSHSTDGPGVQASSDTNYGGFFSTVDGGFAGLRAFNIANTNPDSSGFGVEASTDAVGTGAAGVYGEATQGSGQTYGVRGVTGSPDGYGLGTPDDARVGGTMEVEGHQQVSGALDVGGTVSKGVGASVYAQDTGQTIPADNTEVTVDFNRVVADHRNEWDGSNDLFTCANDGHYHVEAQVVMSDLDEGEHVILSVKTPSRRAETSYISPQDNLLKNVTVSKTLMNLTAGTDIELTIRQPGGTSTGIYPFGSHETYMTIAQIG
jgi:hypothetical protein